MKKVSFKIWIISFTLFSIWSTSSFARAEEDNELIKPSDTIKVHALENYIKIAILNNPGLKASYNNWQAALEKVETAKALPDPRLTFSSYIEEVETRTGAQKFSLGISQTLPWFGKLDLKGKAALQAANFEKALYDAQKLSLISKIKRLYYEYSYITRATKITQDNIALVKSFENVASTRYRGGTGLQNTIIKIQVELGKLEDHLASLKDSLRPVAAKLNSAMNRSPSERFPLPDRIPDQKIHLDRAELISLLKKNNPVLKSLEYMAEKGNYLISLAKKNDYPDVTFGLKYIDTESRSDANPPENGKDPVVASVSINLPLGKKKYDSIEKNARAEHQSVLQSRKQKENSLVADLETAFFNLRNAERKMDLYKETLLPKAEQNLSINQLAFSSDKASFLDLIDAQRVLLEFQLAEEKARAEYGTSLAEIEMLTGLHGERKIK